MVLLAACIIQPQLGCTENPMVLVRLMDLSSEGVTIYKRTIVGQASALKEVDEVLVAGISKSEPVSQGNM